jgi:hypothetical protein
MRDYFAAAEIIDDPFVTRERFIVQAIDWLSTKHGDLHLEFHKDEGWQVGTCFIGGKWDGWIKGPLLIDALAKAVVQWRDTQE